MPDDRRSLALSGPEHVADDVGINLRHDRVPLITEELNDEVAGSTTSPRRDELKTDDALVRWSPDPPQTENERKITLGGLDRRAQERVTSRRVQTPNESPLSEQEREVSCHSVESDGPEPRPCERFVELFRDVMGPAGAATLRGSRPGPATIHGTRKHSM